MSYAESVKSRGYLTLSKPRKWTDSELAMLSSGMTSAEIAAKTGRTVVSVSVKRKRQKMKAGAGYNRAHAKHKYAINEWFLSRFPASVSVADMYSGPRSWYAGKVGLLLENDLRRDGRTALDALRGLSDSSFDIVDLDPFGSCVECYEDGLRVARLGLIVTFGEMGHVRFKRLDFVEKHHGIKSLADFTPENIEKTLFATANRLGTEIERKHLLKTPRLARGYYLLRKPAH